MLDSTISRHSEQMVSVAPENPPDQMINLLVVDDHVIIRRGLKYVLDTRFGITKFHEADTCNEVLQKVTSYSITHIILDLQLNDGNAIEIISDLIEQNPEIKILVYTMNPEDVFAPRLLKLGVIGFLNKQADEEMVYQTLSDFFKGISKKPANSASLGKIKTDPFLQLSKRELTVLSYLLKGESIKEISERLQLKSSTVATFKARIFNKLSVSNVIELKDLVEQYGKNKI